MHQAFMDKFWDWFYSAIPDEITEIQVQNMAMKWSNKYLQLILQHANSETVQGLLTVLFNSGMCCHLKSVGRHKTNTQGENKTGKIALNTGTSYVLAVLKQLKA